MILMMVMTIIMFMILYSTRGEKVRVTMVKMTKKKVLEIALFVCLFAVACHNTNLAGESSYTDSISTTTETTKYAIPLSTDPLPQMYSYRIIGGINPVEIQLPFKIEDYLKMNDNGNRVFDLDAVANDCGWKMKDGYYYYDYDEVWLKLEMYYDPQSRCEGEIWLSMLRWTYVYSDSPEKIYYDFEGSQMSNTDGFEMIFAFDDNCEICETKDGSFLYFRDAVIVASILSTAMVKPGVNPTTTYGLTAYGSWPSNEADKREKTNKFYICGEVSQ